MPRVSSSHRAGRKLAVTFAFELELDVDARTMVGLVQGTIVERCREGLRAGVRPDTGEPRPAHADGTTWGVESGRLLGGIASASISGGEELAQGNVIVPPERQGFAAYFDVLTVDGLVDAAIEQTIDDYFDRASK